MGGREQTIEMMEALGIEITRQNYIEVAWGEPLPQPWTAELESELPTHLQDWSLFELDKETQELKLRG